MIDTTQCSPSGGEMESFNAFIERFDGNERTVGLVKTFNAVLAALDYNDSVLIESSLNSAMEAIATATESLIEEVLGSPETIRGYLPGFWNMMEECPPESFQEIGKQLAARFDHNIKVDEELLDELVKPLLHRGYEIRTADKLVQEIVELQTMKVDTMKDWTWQDRELPAVDRAMVARTREAITRGERGIRIEDLVSQTGGKSDK